MIASFGSSKPYSSKAFDLTVELDSPLPSQEKPLRYGKLPEIHHQFKADPTSPPKIITVFFTAAVVFTLPVLLATVCSIAQLDSSYNYLHESLLTIHALVVNPRRKPQSHRQSIQLFTHPTRSIFSVDTSNGRTVLHVLYIMESLPDTTRRRWDWSGNLPQR